MTYTSRSRRLSAQIAFEYMFIFAIFMAAMILGTMFAWSRSLEVNRYYTRLQVNNLLETVAGKINTAWLEGDGFSTNVTIPETVASLDYTLNVTSNYVLLTIMEEDYIKPIITQNVTGDFTIGDINTLTNTGEHIKISSQ